MKTNEADQSTIETLETFLTALLTEYHHDMYLLNYQSVLWVNLSDKYKLLDNTIAKYKEHHDHFDERKIKTVYEEFYKLIQYDEIISFQHTLIYKELYKILHLIDNTIQMQFLLNDSSQYPTGFAEIQSDMKEIKSRRRHYKKCLIGDTAMKNKGEARLRYWLMTLYYQNKELFKFFLHSFTNFEVEKMKLTNEDKKHIELVLENFEFFLTQKTTINAVIKSLGILLYWEMKYLLKINEKTSNECVQNIIFNLFNQDLNAHEFNRHISIKSTIGKFPIFAASKKNNLNGKEVLFIKRKLLQEVERVLPNVGSSFEPFFDSFIKTPHIQYLQKYPVEFFRINPKYSS